MRLRVLTRGLLLAALALAAAVPAAAASDLRSLTLNYHGVLIGSGTLNEDFSGVSTFAIPTTWQAAKKGRFYNLAPPTQGGCTTKVQVNNQPTLTRASTKSQVAATLKAGLRVAELGRGPRVHGSGGADERTTHASPRSRRVYAIGIIHLSGHVYDRLRAVATFSGSCSDDLVRRGSVLTALKRIVRTGTFKKTS